MKNLTLKYVNLVCKLNITAPVVRSTAELYRRCFTILLPTVLTKTEIVTNLPDNSNETDSDSDERDQAGAVFARFTRTLKLKDLRDLWTRSDLKK